jgi:hypothetical protein
MDRFNLEELINVEVNERIRIKISKRFGSGNFDHDSDISIA